MADVDIWLRTKELPEAVRLMTELGFRAAGKEARPPALQLLSGGAIRFYRPEWRQGLVKLHRSAFPGWWLRRFVSPESVLGGIDLRNSRARYLLLLALVDRPRAMLYLLWRTVWPERAWLAARYQNQSGRGRHLWLLCQGTI